MKYSHSGNAKVSTLAVALSPTGLTITGADLTGWPDGSEGPFWASADKGTLSEEKILCSSRSGNILQVWTDVGSNGRGMDDTVAQAHNVNATLEHVWTATEAEAASAHINETNGAHGYPAAADLVTLSGDQIVTGEKTLIAPIIEGGTHTGATKMTVAGDQNAAEFRVRNTYIGVGPPANTLGNDGDLYIDRG